MNIRTRVRTWEVQVLTEDGWTTVATEQAFSAIVKVFIAHPPETTRLLRDGKPIAPARNDPLVDLFESAREESS